MDDSNAYIFGYAIGTVLAGFIFSIPAWVVARSWNQMLPEKKANPWTLPCISSVLVFALGVLGAFAPSAQIEDAGYGPVLALGLVPSVLWCFFRRRAYGKNLNPPIEDL